MLATKNDNLQQLQYFMEYLLAFSSSFPFLFQPQNFNKVAAIKSEKDFSFALWWDQYFDNRKVTQIMNKFSFSLWPSIFSCDKCRRLEILSIE